MNNSTASKTDSTRISLSNSSHRANSPSSFKKHDNLKVKIEEITKQIQKLREDRQNIDGDVKSTYTKKLKSHHHVSKRPQTSNYPNHSTKDDYVYNHTRMHHPNLEFVLAEVSMSPYLTDPLDKYPQTALKVIDKIRELRQKGLKYKNIPKEDLPFDFEKVRDTFVNDILKASDIRKSEEFGRQPSLFTPSASVPSSIKKSELTSAVNNKPMNPLAASNPNPVIIESFSANATPTKKPVKLRRQVNEARKSTPNLISLAVEKNQVAVSPNKKNDKKLLDKHVAPRENVIAKKSTPIKLKSCLSSPKPSSEPTFITDTNSNHDAKASRARVNESVKSSDDSTGKEKKGTRPPLMKKESTTSIAYSDDFHEESSVHDGDKSHRSSFCSGSKSHTLSSEKLHHRRDSNDDCYSIDSDQLHDHIIDYSIPSALIVEDLSNVSSSVALSVLTTLSPGKSSFASSKKDVIMHEKFAITPDIDDILPVDDGMDSSNDLAMSRSMSASGDFVSQTAHLTSSLNKDNITALKSVGSGLGVAESKSYDDEFGDMSVGDEMTVTWNHARNIRLQSISNISTMSHESFVEDYINSSALNSAKSSRTPSANAMIDFPSSPSGSTIPDHIMVLQAIPSTSSYGSVEHDGYTIISPVEKGSNIISTIIEESSNLSPLSPKVSHQSKKEILPFSPDAVMDIDTVAEVPALEIVKSELFPSDNGHVDQPIALIKHVPRRTSFDMSNHMDPPFVGYERSRSGSQRRLSIKISSSMVPVAEAVANAVNGYKTPSSSINSSRTSSSLTTARDPLMTARDVKTIPEDEASPKANESPTSIEAAFVYMDRMGGGSERRLSTKSTCSRGEDISDYSNLPNYMKPTLSQSTVASPGKNPHQSFRGNSFRGTSSSKLNIQVPLEYISPIANSPHPLSAAMTPQSVGSPNTLSYSMSTGLNMSMGSPTRIKSSGMLTPGLPQQRPSSASTSTKYIASPSSPSPSSRAYNDEAMNNVSAAIAINDEVLADPSQTQRSEPSNKSTSMATNDEVLSNKIESKTMPDKRTVVSERPLIISSSNSVRFKTSSKSPISTPTKSTPRSPVTARSPSQSKLSSPRIMISTASPDKRPAGNVVDFSPWMNTVSPKRSDSSKKSGKLSPYSTSSSKAPNLQVDTAHIHDDNHNSLRVDTITPHPNTSSNVDDNAPATSTIIVLEPASTATSSPRAPQSPLLSTSVSPKTDNDHNIHPRGDNTHRDDRSTYSSGYDSSYSPSDYPMTRDVSYLSRYSSVMTNNNCDSVDPSESSGSLKSEIKPYIGKK